MAVHQLSYKYRDLYDWYFLETNKTGVSLYGDIMPRLPKYHEAIESEAAKLIAAVESDNMKAADGAVSRIKGLYGRAVARLKEEMKRRAVA